MNTIDTTTTGYICKSCGDVAPAGIGYTSDEPAARQRSSSTLVCACGRSRIPTRFTLGDQTHVADADGTLRTGLIVDVSWNDELGWIYTLGWKADGERSTLRFI